MFAFARPALDFRPVLFSVRCILAPKQKLSLKQLLKPFPALLMLCVGLTAQAEPITLSSPQQQTTLLELYTSEGCSSCPTADKWLSGLQQDPRLWRQVIPVAFHVDYWDYIGWPDRFAAADYGRRQRNHAMNWGNGRVYTPGLVQNGQEWSGWFRNRELQLDRSKTIGSLQLRIDGNTYQARFEPVADSPAKLELNLALLGFDLQSEIAAGENRGRTLRHDFVVLAYQRVPLQPSGRGFKLRSELPTQRFQSNRRAVAAWISKPHDPRPLQAVGGWL